MLSAGLYDVLALLHTDSTITLRLALASGWLHCIVQPANLVTQQRLALSLAHYSSRLAEWGEVVSQ